MKKSGQRVRFSVDVGRNLEHDLSVAENVLFGEKDAAKRAATELAQQLEPGKVIAGNRQLDRDIRESQCRVGVFEMHGTERIDVVVLRRQLRPVAATKLLVRLGRGRGDARITPVGCGFVRTSRFAWSAQVWGVDKPLRARNVRA